jgi:hypothetical protein
VEEFLVNSDIARLFVGHTPHGECPSVIRRAGLVIVMGDTSYSDMGADKTRNPANSRGACASTTSIRFKHTEVEGVLKSGEVNKYRMSVDESRDIMPDSLVGRQLVNDSWVKGCVDGMCLVAKGEGFRLDVEKMKPSVVVSMLKPAPQKVPKREPAVSLEVDVGVGGGGKKAGGGRAAFLERQKVHSEKQKTGAAKREADLKAKEEKEAQFRAKKLEKGKMARESALLKEKEKAKAEEREKDNWSKGLERGMLSEAPARQTQAELHETEAQRRGRERREAAREEDEKKKRLGL